MLWHRSFRLLWFGETISGAGTAMAAAGMPLLAVTVLHASTFAVAAITAAAYQPWLVIGLPAGAWVDRLPARPLMIACDAVSALLYASLPVAAWMGVLTTGQVLVVALLAGAASVFFATAYQVLLPSLVAAADLVEGNAKLQGSAAVAAIGGRGAAGLAAEAIGAASALLFNAASFLVSAACLLRIRAGGAPHRPDTRTTTVRAEITQGVRFIAADPYLRPLTLYGATANFGYTGSTALLVVFLVRVAGFGEAAVGVLLAAGTIGGVLGAMNARRLARWLGTARAMVLSVLTAGVFSLLIPLTGTGPRAACYVAGAAVASAGISVGNIVTGSFRQAYCPPSMLGRVSAGMRFLVFGAIPLGALLAGWLATALGTRNALWIVLAEYALSGAVLLTPAMLSNRDLPSTTVAIRPLGAAAALSSPVTTSGRLGRAPLEGASGRHPLKGDGQMALFGRRKNGTQGIPGGIPREFPGGSPGQVPGGFPGPVGAASGLGQAALTQGWQPVGDQPFDGHLEGRVPAITSCLWGMNRGEPKQQNYNTGTSFRDAFRGSVDGRMVTVANAWTLLLPPGVRRDPGFGAVGACVVELPSVLPILCVQPRRIHAVLGGMPAAPTGNPEFDQRFIVNAVAALGDARQVLTPEVQQRIMARDDWVFCAERYLLGCFSRGPFGSFDEATERLGEVLAIVAAIPESVLPSHVDHSQDDLIDRISRITSVEDALAFLQGLTPGERERLAQSGTPLAAFADCRTPDEAMGRFQSLDQGQRMQLIAMFSEVRDARRNP